MSNIIMPSRRLFLTGLVAAPAVIAYERLMPVRKLIEVENSIQNYEKWSLVVDNTDRSFWMKTTDALAYLHTKNIGREVSMPIDVELNKNRNATVMSYLSQIEKFEVVVMPLPSHMKKSIILT